MIVVADTTPLIALAKIRKFFLLKDLFGELLIPKAVYEEVVDSGKGRPGQKEVEVSSWIKTQVVGDNLAVSALETMLGRGKAETIILANEKWADLVLLDDGEARRKAKGLGLKVTGTVGIILRGAKEGKLRFVPALNELIAVGFRLKKEEYDKMIEIA